MKLKMSRALFTFLSLGLAVSYMQGQNPKPQTPQEKPAVDPKPNDGVRYQAGPRNVQSTDLSNQLQAVQAKKSQLETDLNKVLVQENSLKVQLQQADTGSSNGSPAQSVTAEEMSTSESVQSSPIGTDPHNDTNPGVDPCIPNPSSCTPTKTAPVPAPSKPDQTPAAQKPMTHPN